MTSTKLDAETEVAVANPYTSAKYRGVVLSLLTVVYAFNFIDRQILVILQEVIKADLGLSDTQLGVMTGFVFAIFYVTVGIPIARIADTKNRVKIISICLTIWSGMTALCGLAGNFVQLLLARIGVGIGEAGCSPPAHSMLSDIYPAAKRAGAMAVYSSGIYFGIAIGYSLGGWLGDQIGWRNTLLVVGLPGVALAVLFWWLVKEPAREVAHKAFDKSKPGLVEALAIMWKFPTFRYIALGSAMASFAGYGLSNFLPSFFMRVHLVSQGNVGLMMGLIAGLGGAVGAIGSGFLAQRLAKRNIAWLMLVPALFVPLAYVSTVATLLATDFASAMWAYPIAGIASACYLPASIAAIHNLVPANTRALSSAILFFILNLIGLGLGPVAAGALSDMFAVTHGAGEGLRLSLLYLCLSLFVSMGFYLMAARTIGKDMKIAHGETA